MIRGFNKYRREQRKPDNLVSLQEYISIEAEDATMANETLRGVASRQREEVKSDNRKSPREKTKEKRQTPHSKDVDTSRGVVYHNNDSKPRKAPSRKSVSPALRITNSGRAPSSKERTLKTGMSLFRTSDSAFDASTMVTRLETANPHENAPLMGALLDTIPSCIEIRQSPLPTRSKRMRLHKKASLAQPCI